MSLTGKTVTSIFYTGSTKLVQRGLGMISMLILARILTPEDFGLVSICTLAVFLFNSLSDVGAKQYIIRAKIIDDDLINTAWTLNILIKGAIWLMFFIFTPTIADFMGKPEIETPLRFLSIILVAGLIANPGVWLFSRELNYKPLFKIDIISKLISFTTVLVIAYFDRTYWAMLYGLVLQYLLPSIFSNFVCTHKRKLKLSNIGSQINFSQWVVINSLVGFARGLLLLLSLVVPLAAMMAYFDKEIILLMLGERWIEHSYIFSILAFMMIPGVLFKVLSEYVLAEGGYKPIVYYQVCMTFITLAILYTIIGGNLEVFSQTRLLISVASILIFGAYFQLKYRLFKFFDVILFALPFIAAGIAIFCTTSLDLTKLHWFSRLILGCSIFSAIYFMALLLLVYLNRKRYECTLFLSYITVIKNFIIRQASN